MSVKQISQSTPPAFVQVEYSSVCPFNSNTLRMLTLKVDHFELRGASGEFLSDLPIAASQEPRWSRLDPNLIYFIQGNNLMRFSIVTGNISIVHTFSEYSYIKGMGESDITPDGDTFVFCGPVVGGMDVFSYSLSTGKGQSYHEDKPFSGLKITQTGHIIVSGSKGSNVVTTGIHITDSDPHSAVARYKDKDYFLWCSSNDRGVNKNALCMTDVVTGEMRVLLDLNWEEYGFHISTCDKDFCIIDPYSVKPGLKNQIWMVPYDGSPHTVLCETNSTQIALGPDKPWAYNPQPKASLSRDGTKFLFCSNSGKTSDPNYCDVFMGTIDVPVSIVVPQPPQPIPQPTSLFSGYKEIDFTADEGREWLWYFKVVNGKMTVKVYDKV